MKVAHPLLASLAVGLAAAAATATVVLRLELPALAASAQVILEGRVLETRPEFDARGAVATRVVLSVDRSFKGADGVASFSFAVPGGELGERGLVIAGMPQFAVGEELLLFLSEESPRGIRVPTGLGQGKLVIERDPLTGARSLRRNLLGLALVDGANGQAVPAASSAHIAYDAFVANLAGILSKQAEEQAQADGR